MVASEATTGKLRLMHALAVLATGATFLLLIAGGAVTSLDVGMADTVWPTPPWYLVVLIGSGRALERGLGFLVEHAHRQVGWIVGMLVVAMVVVSLLRDTPRSLRRWSVTLLVLVSVQGVLGGLRVLAVSRELAVVHGIVAHLFFATCFGLVLWTRSSLWQEAFLGTSIDELQRRLRTAALAAGLLAFQLLSGAVLRHLGLGLGVHVLGAVAAALAAMGLGFGCFFLGERPMFAVRSWILMVGAFAQVVLGAAAWVSASGFGPYALGPVTRTHAYSATVHMLLGSVLFATTCSLLLELYAVWARRRAWEQPSDAGDAEPVGPARSFAR